MTTPVTITIDLSDDHLQVLRIVEAAGGAMRTSEIIETLVPGTNAAPGRRLIEGSVRGAAAIGELVRLEMLEAFPVSTLKQITARGREALASARAIA